MTNLTKEAIYILEGLKIDREDEEFETTEDVREYLELAYQNRLQHSLTAWQLAYSAKVNGLGNYFLDDCRNATGLESKITELAWQALDQTVRGLLVGKNCYDEELAEWYKNLSAGH